MLICRYVQALRDENFSRLCYWKTELETVTCNLTVTPLYYGVVEASDITPQESWQPLLWSRWTAPLATR